VKNKLIITFIYLLSFFYFNLITAAIGSEVYIVLKIEDEIVTNLDVIKEKIVAVKIIKINFLDRVIKYLDIK